MRERATGASPESTSSSSPFGGGLAGSDCSPGLLRCVGGQVEASLAGYVPHPCKGSACACPWRRVLACPEPRCVGEAVEIVGVEAAASQLCAPPLASPVHRPVLPSDPPPPICAHAGARCAEGVVFACDRASGVPRVLGACAFGCASPAPEVDDATMDELGPGVGSMAILCRRLHAERR